MWLPHYFNAITTFSLESWKTFRWNEILCYTEFVHRSTILDLLHFWAGSHLVFHVYSLRTLDNLIRPFISLWQPANLYGGHGDLKIARQLQMAHGDDILLMGASSMGSTTATRHEHIESMQSGGEVIPETRQPLPPLRMPETRQPRPPAIMPATRQPRPPVMAPKFVEREKVSHKDIRFQGMISRSFIPKVRSLNWRTKNMEAAFL